MRTFARKDQEGKLDLHVIHLHPDSGCLLQDLHVLEERLGGQHVAVLRRLDQHLVDPAVILPQRLLHVSQLLVQPAALLHPELLYPVLHHDGLEADAEGTEQEETDEENLAGMLLDEMTQLVEFLLDFTSDPEGGFVTRGSTLNIKLFKIIREICEGWLDVRPSSELTFQCLRG